MRGYILPGSLGLLLGLILRWAGLHRPDGLRDALALRRSDTLRTALYALGASMALTALLCWLAVIDVDTIEVLPLTAGAIVGGAVFGAGAAVSGFTPGTAFAGLGGGPFLRAACTLAGCFAGTWLLPLAEDAFAALRDMGPSIPSTLFRVTLDEPFLLDGGFLGQGCLGLLLMTIAACVPGRKPVPLPEAEPELQPSDEDAPAFVALLPGEETLVIDAAAEKRVRRLRKRPAAELAGVTAVKVRRRTSPEGEEQAE